MSRIEMDENGWPVMLAEVSNAGYAVQRKTGSRGGNDAHDAASGKFAAKPDVPDAGPNTATPNADPIELKRMLDAVRDAAREFDTPDEGDIREFLQGRAKNPAQVDIQSFLRAVQEQKKTDLVDMLDQQLRSGGALKRGRRTVKVAAPRGYVKRTLGSLDDAGIAEVMHRLEARGHSEEDLEQFFAKRVGDERKERAKEQKKGIAASDDWTYQYEDLADDQQDFEWHTDPIQMAAEIARNIKPPTITLSPVINVEAPKPIATRNTPVRDEKGVILYTVQEPVEGEDGG